MSAYAFLSSLKLLPVLSYHVGASPLHHGGSPSDGLLLFMDRLSTSCLCGLLCCMACMASSHAHRLVRPWLQSVGSWLPTFDPICWIGRSPDSTRLLIWGCRVWTDPIRCSHCWIVACFLALLPVQILGCSRMYVPLVFYSASLTCLWIVQGSLFPLLFVQQPCLAYVLVKGLCSLFPCIAGLQLVPQACLAITFDLYNTYI